MFEQDERPPGTQDDASGTPDESQDDASEVETDGGSGSEEASGEDELAKLKRVREQLLSETGSKTKRIQDLEAENERLRGTTTPPAPGAIDSDAAEVLEELQALAKSSNKTARALAKATLASLQLAQTTGVDVDRKFQLASITDVDRRKQVEALMSEGLSYKHATEMVELRVKSSAKAEESDDEDEALDIQRAKNKATPRTVSRPVSAAEFKTRFGSRTEFIAELNRLEDAGQDDKRQRLWDAHKNGKVRVPSG